MFVQRERMLISVAAADTAFICPRLPQTSLLCAYLVKNKFCLGRNTAAHFVLLKITFYRLIINIQPELKPIKDLLSRLLFRPALLLQILLLCGRGFRRTRRSCRKRKSDKVVLILSSLIFSYSLFTFFCLDTKESNKEKIKKENLPDCVIQAGIYSTFLSFALILLLYYCDFNCQALMIGRSV